MTTNSENNTSEITPIIREIVRTGVLFPNIILLVDKISFEQKDAAPSAGENAAQQLHRDSNGNESAKVSASGLVERHQLVHCKSQQAFRLYLSDLDKAIQALPERGLHQSLRNGEIREGSIVVLRRYTLARAKRLDYQGQDRQVKEHVLYLKVGDWHSVGHDGRTVKVRDEDLVSEVKAATGQPGDSGSGRSEVKITQQSEKVEPGIACADQKASREEISSLVQDLPNRLEKKRRHEHNASTTAPSRDTRDQVKLNLAMSEEADSSDQKQDQKQDQEQEQVHQRPPQEEWNASRMIAGSLQRQNPSPPKALSPPPPDLSSQTPLQTPLLARPICKPILTPLVDLIAPNPPLRHTLATVLAQITYVSPHTFKPPSLPLRKRDLRIRDASTPQHVLLSVFVDAKNFTPAVGTVALFRGVRTHEWGGGNLKKWPRDYVGGWGRRAGNISGSSIGAGGGGGGGGGGGEPEVESKGDETSVDWYIPDPAEKVEGIGHEQVKAVRDGVQRWVREEMVTGRRQSHMAMEIRGASGAMSPGFKRRRLR